MKLEEGTVEAIYKNQKQHPLYKSPVLQIISYEKVGSLETRKYRYRANISDGRHYMLALFSTYYNAKFDNGLIKRYSLVRIRPIHLYNTNGITFLYINDIEDYEDCNIKIGKPVNINPDDKILKVADYNSNKVK